MRKKNTKSKKKPFFVSPRYNLDDETFFPSSHRRLFYKTEIRWERISEQAGNHRNDGSVLTINRTLSPISFKYGMMRQAALRVRCLNLYLDCKEGDMHLPEWMDVISTLLVNLNNITLKSSSKPSFAINDDGKERAISKRMQRLYILYRMPTLKSIDNVQITSEEREMVGLTADNNNGQNQSDSKEQSKKLIQSEEEMGIEVNQDFVRKIGEMDITSSDLGGSREVIRPLQDITTGFQDDRRDRITIISEDFKGSNQMGTSHRRLHNNQPRAPLRQRGPKFFPESENLEFEPLQVSDNCDIELEKGDGRDTIKIVSRPVVPWQASRSTSMNMSPLKLKKTRNCITALQSYTNSSAQTVEDLEEDEIVCKDWKL